MADPTQIRCKGCHSLLAGYTVTDGIVVIHVKHCGRDAIITIPTVTRAASSAPNHERPVARPEEGERNGHRLQ